MLVSKGFAENLEILGCLVGAQVGEHLRIAHLGDTVPGEGGCSRGKHLLIEAEARGGVRPVVVRRRLRTSQATRHRYSALVEEDNVIRLRDRRIEGVGIRVGDRDAGAARASGGGDERAEAVPGGGKHGERHRNGPLVGWIEVIHRHGERHTCENRVGAETGVEILQELTGARRLRGSGGAGGGRRGRFRGPDPRFGGARCEQQQHPYLTPPPHRRHRTPHTRGVGHTPAGAKAAR